MSKSTKQILENIAIGNRLQIKLTAADDSGYLQGFIYEQNKALQH